MIILDTHTLFDVSLVLVERNGHVTFLGSTIQKDARSPRLQDKEDCMHYSMSDLTPTLMLSY